MEIQEMIKVMQDYEDGKPIEYMAKDGAGWCIATHPCWDWLRYNYRVRQSKYKLLKTLGVYKKDTIWEKTILGYTSHCYSELISKNIVEIYPSLFSKIN